MSRLPIRSLARLAAGVDNWDGYGYAHELMREWDQGDGR